METLLTVVIPCFNISNFIRPCLDSLLAQSYKKYFVILVDDGSTDETGNICDEYTLNDNRFSVIHTTNNGSSVARMIGLVAAKTEFVTFVDADDIIHPMMYHLMMNALKDNKDADIAVCGVADLYEKEVVYRHLSELTDRVEVVDRIEGVRRILDDTEWKSYMYNKVYRKNLFNDILFPVGRNLDEDTSIMHLVFHKARKSVYNPSEVYFYRHRNGSICLSYDFESMTKKAKDRIAARWERLQFVEAHNEYHIMLNKQRNSFLAIGLAVMRIVAKYPNKFPPHFFELNRQNIKSVKPLYWIPDFFNYRKRIELAFIKYAPSLFRLAYKIIPAW